MCLADLLIYVSTYHKIIVFYICNPVNEHTSTGQTLFWRFNKRGNSHKLRAYRDKEKVPGIGDSTA